MKSFISLFTIVFAFALIIPCQAKENEDITLIVTSDGKTKDEAIKNTLRTAIEQAYGVFISANTDILNDELVKDEIATISSGNIRKFKEIAVGNESGKITTTLEVIVSKGKLISYAKSKGAECELDGAALASDIELQILYSQNEEMAVQNLIKEFVAQLPNCFDYAIYTDKFTFSPQERRWDYNNGDFNLYRPETKYQGDIISIPFKVTASLNKNGGSAISDFVEKLSQIGKPLKQLSLREKSDEFKECFEVPFVTLEKDPYITHMDIYRAASKYPDIYLRSKKSLMMLEELFNVRLPEKGTTPINHYLADFYIDLGDGNADNQSIKTVGEDGILINIYTTDARFNPLDTVRDEVGAEYYFRFGWITLPKEQVKLLRNIKVVHN